MTFEKKERESIFAQINKLVELGIGEVVSKSNNAYITEVKRSLGLIKKPEGYEGIFDTPLFVDPRVGRKEVLNLFGIRNRLNLDPRYTSDKTFAPKDPYIVWVSDAKRYRQFSFEQAEERFGEGEKSATFHEVAFYLGLDLEVLKVNEGIEAGGTVLSDKTSVPVIERSYKDGVVEARASWQSFSLAIPTWGILSRGTRIQVLK